MLEFKDEQKRAEKFNKEIPENLDNAWKRCRKVIKMTRPSVNYAKDRLDHSFLFPGLVWSEKEFHFRCDH